MKKLLSLFSLVLLLWGCRGDDDSIPPLVFDLNATGTVADQTVEEAQKTINGKWNVASSSSSSAKATVNCSFYGIEFTDDRYLLGIQITGTHEGESVDELVMAYGTYTLEEAADGTVSSVDLYERIDGTNQRIARLTDIVVEESNNELTADFTVQFTLPDDFEFPCGDLSGDYSADKAEPVNGAEDAGEESNFDLLVNTWSLSDYSNSEGGTLAQMLYEVSCFDHETDEEIPNCEAATSAEVSFSAYGSYIFTFENEAGEVLATMVDSWRFNNTEQTEILVDGDFVLSIESLTNVLLRVNSPDEGDGFTETWNFIRVSE